MDRQERLSYKLETKPSLKFNNPTRQSALGSTEERILHLRARAVEIKWLQVQEIEDVEEVCLYFEKRSFAEQATQAKLLTNGHIDIKVTRTAERVAADTRQLKSCWRSGAEEVGATAREVTAVDEGVV